MNFLAADQIVTEHEIHVFRGNQNAPATVRPRNRRRSRSLAASLCFEQSYMGVDGDSASSTEIYALLSALAELPIRQELAVTGSVQSIGGVERKN